MTQATSTSERSDRAAESRARILDAALKEFSANGLAGARTEQIAALAGVNKALLYYYFESKENLYLAALEMIAARVRDRTMAIFLREASAGERFLRSVLEHFDRILTQHEFQAMLQQEMIRMHKGESGAMPLLVKRIFAPAMTMYQAIVREGAESGELISADWLQMQLASIGGNVFYFLSAPVWRILQDAEPFTPEAIAYRRKAVVEFLGQAVFIDRQRGAQIAARVLADTPIPEFNLDRLPYRRKDERA
ncbi:MAG: TetR family transcriptional regulator [Terracidiphilus sp.]